MPLPQPRDELGQAGQVLVRVHATSINPLDYQVRRGDYSDYVPLPAITGHDVSGVIEEKGADVGEFNVGDEVYYTPKIFGGAGSYAEAADGYLADPADCMRGKRKFSTAIDFWFLNGDEMMVYSDDSDGQVAQGKERR